MSVSIGNIVIDTRDIEKATTFWREVTGYSVSSSGDTAVYLEDPENKAVGLSLQQVPEPRRGKNRVHLDLFTDDLAGETERITGLGGSEVERYNEDGSRWTVMSDPDGNQFCVCAA
jgi:predicted enzyme related to lactoylglutathione lyase